MFIVCTSYAVIGYKKSRGDTGLVRRETILQESGLSSLPVMRARNEALGSHNGNSIGRI